MRPLLSLHPAGSYVAGAVFSWVTSFSVLFACLPLVIPGSLPMSLKLSVSHALLLNLPNARQRFLLLFCFLRSHAEV